MKLFCGSNNENTSIIIHHKPPGHDHVGIILQYQYQSPPYLTLIMKAYCYNDSHLPFKYEIQRYIRFYSVPLKILDI